MFRTHLQNFLMAAATALLCTHAARSATLSIAPASQTISQGGTTSVDITVGGLGNGVSPALGSFDLVINFNPTVVALAPAGVTFSSRLGDPTSSSQTQVAPTNLLFPGALEIDEISLLSAADLFALQQSSTGDFIIATLSFQGIANGVSALSITVPPDGLADEGGNDLTPGFTMGTASITVGGSVSTSPEPSAFALLLVAGSGLLFVKRHALKFR